MFKNVSKQSKDIDKGFEHLPQSFSKWKLVVENLHGYNKTPFERIRILGEGQFKGPFNNLPHAEGWNARNLNVTWLQDLLEAGKSPSPSLRSLLESDGSLILVILRVGNQGFRSGRFL